MRKIIALIMFMLFVPIAYSLYGGENWSYLFNECSLLEVNIIGTDEIDDNEYTIINNCSKIEDNYYTCDCYNNYNFTIKFNDGAVNNYTINFNYKYTKTFEDSSSDGSSGSSGSSSFTARINKQMTLFLIQNVKSYFYVNNERHTIKIIEIRNDSVLVEVESNLQRIELMINETKYIDLNENGIDDVKLTLKNIRGRAAYIVFDTVPKHIDYPADEIEDVLPIDGVINESSEIVDEDNVEKEEKVEDKKSLNFKLIIILAIFLFVLIIYLIYVLKINKDQSL